MIMMLKNEAGIDFEKVLAQLLFLKAQYKIL
jgi:hypothetical protein